MEVLVQHLDKVVNGFQVGKIVVPDVDADAKVQSRITSVDDFEAPELKNNVKKAYKQMRDMGGNKGDKHLHKICVFGIANGDQRVHLLNQLLLLIIVEMHVPLGEPCLPCAVLD